MLPTVGTVHMRYELLVLRFAKLRDSSLHQYRTGTVRSIYGREEFLVMY